MKNKRRIWKEVVKEFCDAIVLQVQAVVDSKRSLSTTFVVNNYVG
jgi:hypothetical protein